MAVKMVAELFKKNFAKFLAKHGFNWHNGFFAKYENGIFIKIYSECIKSKNGCFVDVIYQPTPTFCKIDDENGGVIIELSVARLLAYDKSLSRITGEVTEQAVSDIMAQYADVFAQNYEHMFCYKSVTDYAEKVTDYFMNITNNYNTDRMHYFEDNIKYLNFSELAYIWYRTGKQEKCKRVIVELINACKEFLYERTQLSYVADSHQSGRINQDIERATNCYNNLITFAEALFEENKKYFDELDKIYNRTEIQSIGYISSLIAG